MHLITLINKLLDGAKKRRFILLSYDILCFTVTALFYYLVSLRAANSMPVDDLNIFIIQCLLQLALMITVRLIAGVYQNVWRYSNTRAYFMMVVADAVSSVATLALLRIGMIWFDGLYTGVWQAVSIGSLTALLSLVSRFGYTMLYKSAKKNKTDAPRVPVVIVVI